MRGWMGVNWTGREGGSRAIGMFATPVIVVSVTALLQLVASSSALAASTVTQTFKPTAQTQSFTVPAGVTELQITVRGGAGGSGFSGGSTAGAGGSGTQVTGLLGVSPGQTLYMSVGSAGGSATSPNGSCGFNDPGDISNGGGGGSSNDLGKIGGGGGRGDLCGGGGGGGGGADTILMQNNGYALSVDAGGGGGGGGGGGIAGYGGGAGGSGGSTAGNGGAGSGPGHGSGGAGAGHSNPGGEGGDGSNDAVYYSSAGGGGGGGAGYKNGGSEGGYGTAGAGGGGGGGAGNTYVANWIGKATVTAGPAGVDGVVVFSYAQPTTLGAPPPTAHRYTIALRRCTRTSPGGKRRCTARLISARLGFPVTKRDRLTLIRRGYVYATGQRRGKRIVLTVHRRVRRGHYTLVVAKGTRRHPLVLRHRIMVR